MGDIHWVSELKLIRLIKHEDGCCDACHADLEEGYSDMVETYLGVDKYGRDRLCHCCCTVSIAFDEWKERKDSEKF